MTKTSNSSVKPANKDKIPWHDLKSRFSAAWHKLIHLNAGASDIAFGMAIGIFVGFLPIMGIQMLVAAALSMLFKRANTTAAIAGVWISNPLTVIPIYAFIYWVGIFFYPPESVFDLTTVMARMEAVFQLDGIANQTYGFLALGADIFLPMCVGGVVVGVIAMFPTYFITKKVILFYRNKKKGNQ